MLAKIFLHQVLDAWDERDVRPRMKGHCFLLRFAADFIIGCEREDDARRIMAVLPLKAQYRILCQKLRGHYQYYGIRGNYPRLAQLYEHAVHAWRYWLSRRSHKSAIPRRSSTGCMTGFRCPHPASSTLSEGVCGAAKLCVRVVSSL